jgi:hypothetical protein
MAKKKKPSQPPPIDDGYHEFYGEHDDPDDSIGFEAMEALNLGDAAGLAQQLRQIHCSVSDLLWQIADLLDTEDQKKLRLKFVGPKGRPADKNRIYRDSGLHMQVKFAFRKLKTEKLEAAIQHVSTTAKVSRARVRRAWDRYTPKKAAKKKSAKPKI